MTIGVDTASLVPSSDADFLLAPHAALRVAAECNKVLIVFDDVLIHK